MAVGRRLRPLWEGLGPLKGSFRVQNSAMGSLRPSRRSKVSGPIPRGPTMANGNQIPREELSVFESASFDADSYVQGKCQSMSEKGIRRLCAELLELKKDSAEEMRKSVYANYSAFIRTSREISDLEGELVSMRNLLSTQATLVHKLAAIHLPPMVSENGAAFPHENGYLDDNTAPGLESEAEALPDIIDVHIEERKIGKALEALEKGEELTTSLKLGGSQDQTLSKLENALTKRKIRLAKLLTEFTKQPSIRGAELRSVIAGLDKLGDGPQAHTLLLNAYHERIERGIHSLRPSGTSFGGAYTAALCQLVFSHIAQAGRDSSKVFGDQPAYASELVLWARNETENFAMLIKKHVLSASAASGGLRAAAECVQIALGHCALLEAHGLALCPVLNKLVKPSVEQALDANLRRIEDSVSFLAAADDWVLTQPPARAAIRAGNAFVFPPHVRLTASAYRFISMVQDFVDDVTPLTSMHLTSTTVDGLSRLFESYIHLLMRAMPATVVGDEDMPEITDNLNIRIAETDVEKLSLLGNAAALADELLPRAIAKILPLKDIKEDIRGRRSLDKQSGGIRSEHRDFRRRTQRAVDKLRDRFCQKHALELIYTDDGESLLSADLYLGLDSDNETYSWNDDAMPSPVFQALFDRFKAVAAAGAEVMPGRERFLTVLLIRLVEFVVMLLSSDQEFWEDIEDGPRPLGPVGLQQMVLDMHFALQMAGQMNHSSLRHLNQLIGDIISRAVEAFAATGMDPNSVLPDNKWFLATAQDAIERLSAGWSKDPTSPAASVSANSVSSIRSHGSP